MKQNLFLALTSLALVSMLAGSANAQSIDVSVRLNGGSVDSNKVFIGKTNRLEILVRNSVAVEGLGMCFRVNSSAPYTWSRPYGNKPNGNSAIIQEHGPAVGLFASINGLNVFDHINSTSPDTFGVGGVGTPTLVSSATNQLCYSLKFTVSGAATPQTGGFCIDNVWNSSIPTGYQWLWIANGSGVTPTYQGNANASAANPSAPAVCFDIVNPPAIQGDVNCDGMISISDATYLINYIFAGGPAPCAN